MVREYVRKYITMYMMYGDFSESELYEHPDEDRQIPLRNIMTINTKPSNIRESSRKISRTSLSRSVITHLDCNTHDTITHKYGVTVSISPTKKMNKRYWKHYSHDKQREILARVEARYRRDTPSTQLIAIEYEVQPILGNIHFHALYEMPVEFQVDQEAYYNRVCSSADIRTIKPYRHYDCREIFNEEGWIRYITKGLKV